MLFKSEQSLLEKDSMQTKVYPSCWPRVGQVTSDAANYESETASR